MTSSLWIAFGFLAALVVFLGITIYFPPREGSGRATLKFLTAAVDAEVVGDRNRRNIPESLQCANIRLPIGVAIRQLWKLIIQSGRRTMDVKIPPVPLGASG